MDMDFAERLKGFEAVWRRVQKQQRSKPPAVPKAKQAQPPQKKPGSRAKRFDMGR